MRAHGIGASCAPRVIGGFTNSRLRASQWLRTCRNRVGARVLVCQRLSVPNEFAQQLSGILVPVSRGNDSHIGHHMTQALSSGREAAAAAARRSRIDVPMGPK